MPRKRKFTEKVLATAERKLADRYLKKSSITGVDIGFRWKDGVRTDERVLRVHVREKRPESALADHELIPKMIDGVPVDVYEGAYAPRRATMPHEHQSRFSPLLAGVSISNDLENSAGTLGIFVRDKTSGDLGFLSNWHVLVGPMGNRGTRILQPGRVDGGGANDVVGSVDRWILDGDGDAAIALLDPSRHCTMALLGSTRYPGQSREVELGETLFKSGRTTGLTRGFVEGIGTYKIDYELRPDTFSTVAIRGFKTIPPGTEDLEISSSGDSGALMVSEAGDHAVGLHFAGETDPHPSMEHAIACHFPAVLRRLGCELATETDIEAFNATAAPKANLSAANSFSDRQFSIEDLLHAYELGCARGPASKEMIALSQPELAPKEIAKLDIWAKILRLFDQFPRYNTDLELATRIADLFPRSATRQALGTALRDHLPFNEDGIQVSPLDVQSIGTLAELLALVESAYRGAGWTVTN